MITETFLNECVKLVFAPKEQSMDMSTYRDLLTFLDFSKRYFHNGDLAISAVNKFDLVKMSCEHILKGGTMIELLMSVGASEKFKQHKDLIRMFQEEPMGEAETSQWQRTIQKMIAFCRMNSTFQQFDKYRDIILNGNFGSIEEMIEEWRNLVKTASSAVADYELKTRSDLVSSFNTRSDGPDSIIREIRKKYSKVNVVPSGIPELDNEFLNGGFQPSRVHLFGGTSGSGKSMLLLNFAKRAAMSIPSLPFNLNLGPCALDDSPERVFLYVTMENYVYETWVRLYCSLFNKSKGEMLQELYSGTMTSDSIREQINTMMAPYNSSIQIEYFPAQSISPATISSLIAKLNEHPSKRTVKAVYIDYLDLMVPDERTEMYRLDLGEITSRLKAIAGNFEIPIITATQLNREAYRKGKGSEIGSEMISESIQKLFIADFSAMMYLDNPDDKTSAQDVYMPQKVVLKVDKNRDGKTGKTHIYMNYPQSRFLTQQEYMEEYQKLLEI